MRRVSQVGKSTSLPTLPATEQNKVRSSVSDPQVPSTEKFKETSETLTSSKKINEDVLDENDEVVLSTEDTRASFRQT